MGVHLDSGAMTVANCLIARTDPFSHTVTVNYDVADKHSRAWHGLAATTAENKPLA